MNCPRCVRRTSSQDLGAYRSAGPIESPIALAEEKHPAGVAVARCPSCTGAFVEHDAMNKIDAYGRSAGARTTTMEMARRAAAPGGRAISCPACANETTRREWRFSTLVFVDICIDCRGVWLDGGELEAIDGTATR